MPDAIQSNTSDKHGLIVLNDDGSRVGDVGKTGAATSVNQDVLNSLIETLQELSQRLAPLGGAMANTAQLRAVVTGAVTATGGGYITSAQHIANTLTQTNTLRYDPNNTLAIQSNINNVVVT